MALHCCPEPFNGDDDASSNYSLGSWQNMNMETQESARTVATHRALGERYNWTVALTTGLLDPGISDCDRGRLLDTLTDDIGLKIERSRQLVLSYGASSSQRISAAQLLALIFTDERLRIVASCHQAQTIEMLVEAIKTLKANDAKYAAVYCLMQLVSHPLTRQMILVAGGLDLMICEACAFIAQNDAATRHELLKTVVKSLNCLLQHKSAAWKASLQAGTAANSAPSALQIAEFQASLLSSGQMVVDSLLKVLPCKDGLELVGAALKALLTLFRESDGVGPEVAVYAMSARIIPLLTDVLDRVSEKLHCSCDPTLQAECAAPFLSAVSTEVDDKAYCCCGASVLPDTLTALTAIVNVALRSVDGATTLVSTGMVGLGSRLVALATPTAGPVATPAPRVGVMGYQDPAPAPSTSLQALELLNTLAQRAPLCLGTVLGSRTSSPPEVADGANILTLEDVLFRLCSRIPTTLDSTSPGIHDQMAQYVPLLASAMHKLAVAVVRTQTKFSERADTRTWTTVAKAALHLLPDIAEAAAVTVRETIMALTVVVRAPPAASESFVATTLMVHLKTRLQDLARQILTLDTEEVIVLQECLLVFVGALAQSKHGADLMEALGQPAQGLMVACARAWRQQPGLACTALKTLRHVCSVSEACKLSLAFLKQADVAQLVRDVASEVLEVRPAEDAAPVVQASEEAAEIGLLGGSETPPVDEIPLASQYPIVLGLALKVLNCFVNTSEVPTMMMELTPLLSELVSEHCAARTLLVSIHNINSRKIFSHMGHESLLLVVKFLALKLWGDDHQDADALVSDLMRMLAGSADGRDDAKEHEGQWTTEQAKDLWSWLLPKNVLCLVCIPVLTSWPSVDARLLRHVLNLLAALQRMELLQDQAGLTAPMFQFVDLLLWVVAEVEDEQTAHQAALVLEKVINCLQPSSLDTKSGLFTPSLVEHVMACMLRYSASNTGTLVAAAAPVAVSQCCRLLALAVADSQSPPFIDMRLRLHNPFSVETLAGSPETSGAVEGESTQLLSTLDGNGENKNLAYRQRLQKSVSFPFKHLIDSGAVAGLVMDSMLSLCCKGVAYRGTCNGSVIIPERADGTGLATSCRIYCNELLLKLLEADKDATARVLCSA